ncbi:hypothetical protein D9M71_692350 [compost metagenome]
MVIDTVPLSSGMRTMRLRRPKLAWAYGIFSASQAAAEAATWSLNAWSARGSVTSSHSSRVFSSSGCEPLQW